MRHFRDAVELYEYMLSQGVAKECARSVLPLNTVTRSVYVRHYTAVGLHYIAPAS